MPPPPPPPKKKKNNKKTKKTFTTATQMTLKPRPFDPEYNNISTLPKKFPPLSCESVWHELFSDLYTWCHWHLFYVSLTLQCFLVLETNPSSSSQACVLLKLRITTKLILNLRRQFYQRNTTIDGITSTTTLSFIKTMAFKEDRLQFLSLRLNIDFRKYGWWCSMKA